MAWLFIRADRCFSRFANKPMINQIKIQCLAPTSNHGVEVL